MNLTNSNHRRLLLSGMFGFLAMCVLPLMVTYLLPTVDVERELMVTRTTVYGSGATISTAWLPYGEVVVKIPKDTPIDSVLPGATVTVSCEWNLVRALIWGLECKLRG